MPQQRPNILIITADSLRHDAISVGNPVVKTPNIDRLTESGVAFTRAYCAAPECLPSRVSMLTGQPPHRTGVFANCRITLDGRYHADRPYEKLPDVPALPDILGEFGYQALSLGTKHNYVGPSDDYRAILRENGFGHIRAPRGRTDRGLWYLPQPSPLPTELHLTHWTADLAIRALEEWRNDPRGPFLLEFTFNKPHAPFDPPDPYDTMYDPHHVDPPIEDPEYRPNEWTFYHLWQNRNKAPWGKTPPLLARMQRAHYYGSVSFVDSQIGRVLDFLDAHGAVGETIVVVTADHGEMLGDHYLYGKRSWYDSASRVPLIISSPVEMPEGARNDDLVSHLGVVPTLLDLARVPFDRGTFGGQSLVPLLAGQPGSSREVLFGQYGENEMAIYACMDQRYKYIYTAAEGREMLFDRLEDPQEQHDLSHEPRSQDHRQRLKQLLVTYFENEDHLGPPDGSDFREFRLPAEYCATRENCIATAMQGVATA